MSKILKPYTIIPQDLYVQRDADRQVKNIIADMGRPGYVLVSRQMGKTNLLLNAKRKLEGENDVFVYIDLSNSFNNAKSCFENIIDIAIETNTDKFENISKIIHSKRKENESIPAHKQHTSELRLLLSAISGKLVIILDEIDALTKTSYSDQIFAQIRSVYFSRVNYSELERLTYILSGVIEPSEIIKDPKISPFNIGQKIFLNDFNKKEFEQLIYNSKLDISQELKDRIFFWTSGNPRMTWDVCSEVENELKNKNLDIEDLDTLIKKMYLTTYDRPPVDHIRELVKEDKEIRNSIIEIEYKKGKEISDKIKSRLYLSGIINYNENDVHIKNEILKKSLNLDWINSIEEEEKGLIQIALEYYEKEDFSNCINTFNRFLIDNEFPENEKSLYYYFMGYSAFRISDFNSGLVFFNKTFFDKEDEAVYYYKTLSFKGLLYYYTGDIDSSLECFMNVLNRNKKDEVFARALVNFGSISLQSHNPIHIDDAKALFNGVIDETGIDSSRINSGLLNEIKAISLHNLAQIELSENNMNHAMELYKKAIPLASEKTRIKISLSFIREIKDEYEKEKQLKSIINLIEESNLSPEEFDPDNPMSFNIEQYKELIYHIFSLKDKSLFKQIKKEFHLLNNKGLGYNLYDVALFGIKEGLNLETARELLTDISTNRDNPEYQLNYETIYNALKISAYYSRKDCLFRNLKLFVDSFDSKLLTEIDFFDIRNFANYIYLLIDKKNYREATKALNSIYNAKNKLPKKYIIDFLVISNMALNLYSVMSNETKAIDFANEILSIINDDKILKDEGYLIKEKELEIVKANAEYILKSKTKITQPIKAEKRISRNDIVEVKYKNGEVVRGKYKKLSGDILSDKCILLKNDEL